MNKKKKISVKKRKKGGNERLTSRGLDPSWLNFRPLRLRPLAVRPAVECLRLSRYSGAECWCLLTWWWAADEDPLPDEVAL